MDIKALQATQAAQGLPLLDIPSWTMPSPQTVRAVDSISGTKLTIFPTATGSTRMPASAHGVWALRMSNNTIPMERVVPGVG